MIRGLARIWIQDAIIRAFWLEGITRRLGASKGFAS